MQSPSARDNRACRGRPAALHVTDDTARHLRYTSRAKREADVSLSHRCTMEHPVAPWSTTMRRVFHSETNGVKASPHRHKWMLSHGAPADPSDPWNSHAAPVSPRQMAFRRVSPVLVRSAQGDPGAIAAGSAARSPCLSLTPILSNFAKCSRDKNRRLWLSERIAANTANEANERWTGAFGD